VQVPIKATGKKLRKLNETGRVTVTARVTTPRPAVPGVRAQPRSGSGIESEIKLKGENPL
jgi:hypothetical protein